MILETLKKEFIEKYGGDPDEIQVFFAPGRVNLIGEHTDYNNGFVLPCSLTYGTWLLARTTVEPKVRFKSMNFPKTAEICLNKEISRIGNEWINYPLGVIAEFFKNQLQVTGMELLYFGDIPNGAGLSSSASIEVVTAFAIDTFMQHGLLKLEMVKIAQKAENDFVGMKCGIMDQFAVTMGKSNHAVFLNCDNLDYELIPLVLNDYKILISNTNKRRELADSKYNERRQECRTAVENLKKHISIDHLSQLGIEKFKSLEYLIKEPVIRKRAKHVISENERVLSAVTAFKQNDLGRFGRLMVDSHNSLRDDYEVSCFELDVLVGQAMAIEGVLGSRMTGGGFGGCTVSLVHKDQIEIFKANVGIGYEKATGLKAEFYLSEPGDGVKVIN
ncbi:MAG: galactokinase [Bacteroidales bacterium]|nr:galactokinase [Bacteroidales bacterium]